MADWFEGLDAEHLSHAETKGWKGPLTPEIATGMLKAHRAAERLIGSDPSAIVKLPKDASDPSYAGIFERVVGLGLPKTPDDYKFDGIKFADGTEFDADDQALVRAMATELKLTPAQARGVAERLVTRAGETFTAEQTNSAAAKAANDTALKTSWGADYDRNAAGAAAVIDALKAKGIPVALDGLDPVAHVAAMTALTQLSQELRESPMLRGGLNMTTPAQAMTPEAAQQRFDELKMNKTWFEKAWNEPGSTEATELHNLQAYMSGVSPEEFAAFKRGERVRR